MEQVSKANELAFGKKTVLWTVLRVGRTGGNPVGATKNSDF